ncbi:MAG: PEP-CTERM sorting domain-containing protein [Armatimonadota bacterium]
MARNIKRMIVLCTVLMMAISGSVSAFSFLDIEAWAGSGSNQAALVIDWNDGNSTECYVWGFRWDGTATGSDMFYAIASAYPELSFVDLGGYIDRITYGIHDEGGWDPNLQYFWNYSTANNTTEFPTEWTMSWVGFAERTLSNNSWDGWAWGGWPTFPSDPTAAPVPEPASIAVLAIGTLPILYRLRKRS